MLLNRINKYALTVLLSQQVAKLLPTLKIVFSQKGFLIDRLCALFISAASNNKKDNISYLILCFTISENGLLFVFMSDSHICTEI